MTLEDEDPPSHATLGGGRSFCGISLVFAEQKIGGVRKPKFAVLFAGSLRRNKKVPLARDAKLAPSQAGEDQEDHGESVVKAIFVAAIIAATKICLSC